MRSYNMLTRLVSITTFMDGHKSGTSEIVLRFDLVSVADNVVSQSNTRVVTLDHFAADIDTQLQNAADNFAANGLEFINDADANIVRKHSLAFSPLISVSDMKAVVNLATVGKATIPNVGNP